MKHPLDGARLKVIRAQEHLDCLKAEVGMYLRQQPDEVRSQPARNPQLPWLSTTQILRPIVPTVPPVRFSTISGDCLANATLGRSSITSCGSWLNGTLSRLSTLTTGTTGRWLHSPSSKLQ